MPSTVTNYLSQINRDFPVRGQDNDAQGFRDNWQNIYDAVLTLNNELDFLNDFTIKINSTSNFNSNTLEDINFKNQSLEIYTLDFQRGSIEIDYTNGNYQKFSVLAGTHNLTVINWPQENKSGKLILSITAPSDKFSAINFNSEYINISSQSNPFELDFTRPNIFELTSEASGTIYVRYLTNYTYQISSSTNLLWTNRLHLGIINNLGESNTFYTGTNKSTIVQRGNQFGELALVPNRIRKMVLDSVDKTSTSPIEIKLVDATDIVPGSFVYIANLPTQFTVTQVTTSSVFIEPGNVDIDLLGGFGNLRFTNPRFEQQSTLLTLNSVSSSELGNFSTFKGSVYAEKNKLAVTFNDYGNNNTNTFVLSKVDNSTNISTAGTELITADFVHSLLPIGSVIMWFGSSFDIPYGWTLCTGGTTSTIINGVRGPDITIPDLRNRFIIGATSDVSGSPKSNITGTPVSTGGSANSVVVRHWHTATFYNGEITPHTHSITDPGHNHTNGPFTNALLPPSSVGLTGAEVNNRDANIRGSGPLVPSPTGITVVQAIAGTPTGNVRVDNSGDSNGVGANVPPFTALYYIMKIAGRIL